MAKIEKKFTKYHTPLKTNLPLLGWLNQDFLIHGQLIEEISTLYASFKLIPKINFGLTEISSIGR